MLQGPSLTLSPLGAPHAPTVFLFGGKFVQNRRLSDEMWAIDLASRVWERVDAGEGPAPRYFHTMDVCTFAPSWLCFQKYDHLLTSIRGRQARVFRRHVRDRTAHERT